ncbi:MAG: Gfo/Idh/MocA family protein [Candidatus Jordarchaeum sp.]|uniref:Gfo/Idh/MocA family protein n=1 Tax=Candidatus Jordarchaeum sp. TaxID=2823881 RepID=UPI004049290F
MKQLRIGVLGCGTAAHFHASACRPSQKIKLVSAYDANYENTKKLADIYHLTASRNYQDILKSNDVDAVLIALPHFLHSDLTIEAAEAGKHILCEKPMAPTLEECDTMIKAAKKAGVKLMIAENHRFLPAHKLIKKVLNEGLIGIPLLVRGYEGVDETPDLSIPEHWKGSPEKAGGGVLMDAGVHKFAILNWMLGDVSLAYCWLAKQMIKLENKADDNAMMFMKFESGCIGEIVVSDTVFSTPNNRLEFYGTEGTILEDHSWKKPVQIFSTVKEAGEKRYQWYSPDVEHEPFPMYYIISFRHEDEHFAECVLEDKQPVFTPEEAKKAVAMVLLGYLSAKTGKTATLEDLEKVASTKGTRSIIEGLEKISI